MVSLLETYAFRPRASSLGHSITSSARNRNDSEIVRPSALAVLRLTASSNFSADCTGNSLGLAPFRTQLRRINCPLGIGEHTTIVLNGPSNREQRLTH